VCCHQVVEARNRGVLISTLQLNPREPEAGLKVIRNKCQDRGEFLSGAVRASGFVQHFSERDPRWKVTWFRGDDCAKLLLRPWEVALLASDVRKIVVITRGQAGRPARNEVVTCVRLCEEPVCMIEMRETADRV
jgi:hypothetical protein